MSLELGGDDREHQRHDHGGTEGRVRNSGARLRALGFAQRLLGSGRGYEQGKWRISAGSTKILLGQVRPATERCTGGREAEEEAEAMVQGPGENWSWPGPKARGGK